MLYYLILLSRFLVANGHFLHSIFLSAIGNSPATYIYCIQRKGTKEDKTFSNSENLEKRKKIKFIVATIFCMQNNWEIWWIRNVDERNYNVFETLTNIAKGLFQMFFLMSALFYSFKGKPKVQFKGQVCPQSQKYSLKGKYSHKSKSTV